MGNQKPTAIDTSTMIFVNGSQGTHGPEPVPCIAVETNALLEVLDNLSEQNRGYVERRIKSTIGGAPVKLPTAQLDAVLDALAVYEREQESAHAR
jgi:hypothetical protein